MNFLCIICTDLVHQAENIYVTKCGHIFHHQCLARWIEGSNTCPQCRNTVTDMCMFRLYPTVSNENSSEHAARLQSKLDDAQLQLRQERVKRKENEDKLTVANADLKRQDDLLKSYENRLVSSDAQALAFQEQLAFLNSQNMDMQRVKDENELLKKNIKALNGSLCDSEAKKIESRERLHAAKQQLGQLSLEENEVGGLQSTVMSGAAQRPNGAPQTKVSQFKLVFVGDPAVGKTSLKLCFGRIHGGQQSTDDNIILKQTVRLDDTTIEFKIWDTSTEDFYSYNDLAQRCWWIDANAAIVVYDITKPYSFGSAKNLVQQARHEGPCSIVIALVGNKSDLAARRMVQFEEAQAYADKNGLLFTETSAKTAMNVKNIFLAIANKLKSKGRDSEASAAAWVLPRGWTIQQ